MAALKMAKLPDLNSRAAIMIMQAIAATVCAVFALSENTGRYAALANALAVGFNGAGIFYNWLGLRTDRLFADIRENFDEMVKLHRAMVDGAGMTLHLMGPFPPDDDEPKRTLN